MVFVTTRQGWAFGQNFFLCPTESRAELSNCPKIGSARLSALLPSTFRTNSDTTFFYALSINFVYFHLIIISVEQLLRLLHLQIWIFA